MFVGVAGGGDDDEAGWRSAAVGVDLVLEAVEGVDAFFDALLAAEFDFGGNPAAVGVFDDHVDFKGRRCHDNETDQDCWPVRRSGDPERLGTRTAVRHIAGAA